MSLTFAERIAGAWLDATEHADQQVTDLMQGQDPDATDLASLWARIADQAENQAGLVADYAGLRTPSRPSR